MKKILLSFVAAAGILLAACTAVTLSQVQAATVQACGFLPTAVAIGSLIPTVDIYVGTAGSIAKVICDAVAAQVPLASHRLHASLRTTTSVNVTLPDGSTATVQGYFVK